MPGLNACAFCASVVAPATAKGRSSNFEITKNVIFAELSYARLLRICKSIIKKSAP